MVTSGWKEAPYIFQEIRPVAGFRTGDFVKEKKWGGGTTVERFSTITRYFVSRIALLSKIYNVFIAPYFACAIFPVGYSPRIGAVA